MQPSRFFAVGAIWRVAGIVRLGRKPDLAPPKGSAAAGWFKGNLRHFVPRGLFAERTWMHLLGGYAFHLGLFVLLVFAAPHIAFFERFTGLSWTAPAPLGLHPRRRVRLCRADRAVGAAILRPGDAADFRPRRPCRQLADLSGDADGLPGTGRGA
ncbi:hypothetical protein ACFOHS_09400 [Jhaorihella thermophila]